ncbi:hypothetical protein [Tenacibaculum sp. MAR_2009_124]|uniref:hypothetical protein n=1 Tax=Tenacibaculum sp. MAR_2009_124 TaxID=1250059 RepID=UPI0015A39BED|nr:hypothetical protein [Tenacibaculum sp. MAR_2009_124]
MITIQKKDTIAYALHGKNINSTRYSEYYSLKDSIEIKKSSIIEQYHSEALIGKGWTDCDFMPSYAYNYCLYQKRLKDRFIVIEDNGLSIGLDCNENYPYYEKLYGSNCDNDRDNP